LPRFVDTGTFVIRGVHRVGPARRARGRQVVEAACWAHTGKSKAEAAYGRFGQWRSDVRRAPGVCAEFGLEAVGARVSPTRTDNRAVLGTDRRRTRRPSATGSGISMAVAQMNGPLLERRGRSPRNWRQEDRAGIFFGIFFLNSVAESSIVIAGRLAVGGTTWTKIGRCPTCWTG
jgi:hypothetical protein